MSDNISVIISFLALCISFSSIIPMLYKTLTDYKSLKVHLRDIELQQKNIEVKMKNGEIAFNNFNIENYLEILICKMHEIYPSTKFDISIKLLVALDESKPMESRLLTCFSYPTQKNSEINIIKDNTAFDSILKSNGDYFLVSDLKTFQKISQYKNDDDNFINKYNTTIVVPIRRKKKDKTFDIIGFLCVNSPQKINNVKKNRMIVEFITQAASTLYDFFIKNSDEMEKMLIMK